MDLACDKLWNLDPLGEVRWLPAGKLMMKDGGKRIQREVGGWIARLLEMLRGGAGAVARCYWFGTAPVVYLTRRSCWTEVGQLPRGEEET